MSDHDWKLRIPYSILESLRFDALRRSLEIDIDFTARTQGREEMLYCHSRPGVLAVKLLKAAWTFAFQSQSSHKTEWVTFALYAVY
jgi:hypothetical protein